MRKRVLDLIENIRAYGGSVFASLLWFQAQVIRRNAWIPVPTSNMDLQVPGTEGLVTVLEPLRK